MKRIKVHADDHTQFLSRQPDKSFDIVYFDPMFRVKVEASTGIHILHALADPHPLSESAVREAVRVAKKRVILKERYHSNEFQRLGFQKVGGGATSIAYGFIDCE
jgi:16S rRNA (guanine1516-N2)-methyltransferase